MEKDTSTVCVSAFFETISDFEDLEMYKLCEEAEKCNLFNPTYDEELYRTCVMTEKEVK